MFKALVLHEKDGKVTPVIEDMQDKQLPAGDVLVRVHNSTLNYKDGLVLNGLGRLVKTYPHVGGIDFAGTVLESQHAEYKAGDQVILTGWRVGEMHWGGYSERARVKGEWLVPLPQGLSTERAMAIGTAGFTAMLCIMALEEHGLRPERGDVLVTGAAGGVGSVATAILASLGYRVICSSGRAEQGDYLRGLGAAEIIERASIAAPSGKPLEAERWAGVVDSVGGATLAAILPQMKYGGTVAACGLAGGTKVDTTVIPFILRSVSLLGIDSVSCPILRRKVAWARLTKDLPMHRLDAMIQRATLADLPQLGKDILEGKVRGRVVVELGVG
jgi:acrylyl-CoA reductase (NADPH)